MIVPARYRWMHGSRLCAIRMKLRDGMVRVCYLDDKTTAEVLQSDLKDAAPFVFGWRGNRRKRR